MQNGEAAFIMNWPYVLSAMKAANKKVADDLGFAKLPTFAEGEPSRATLGGMNYAISTYSKHPEETFDAAMCLRSPEHQLQTSLEAGDPPVAPERLRGGRVQGGLPDGSRTCSTSSRPPSRGRSPRCTRTSRTIVSTTLSPPSSIDPEQTAAAAQGLDPATPSTERGSCREHRHRCSRRTGASRSPRSGPARASRPSSGWA